MNNNQKLRKKRQEEAKKIANKRIENKKNLFKKLSLYHFTDKRNIKSISKHGLYGWKTLEEPPFSYKREIDYFPASNIPAEGSTYGKSRWLDIRKGKEDFIRLSGNMNHPMIGRAEYWNSVDLLFIKISTNIIDDLICEFSNTNATATIAKIDSNISTFLDSKDPQAEVLVEHHIPPEYIEDIIDDWKT